MPKNSIDYSKGIIYKLVSKDLSIPDMYIGSTTNFNKRRNCHKNNCINENNPKYNLKVYQFIRDNNGWDNWDMVEIEKYSCKDKNELFKRERYFYEELKPSLNMCFPQRTSKEYFENYYATNKEKIDEKNIKYYYDNQEELSKKSLNYYHKNKDKINKTCDCICGSHFLHRDKARHEKSFKHLSYIVNLQEESLNDLP